MFKNKKKINTYEHYNTSKNKCNQAKMQDCTHIHTKTGKNIIFVRSS